MRISELFADDMVVMAESERNLQHNINLINRELQGINMSINVNKAKSMLISLEGGTHKIIIEGEILEQVNAFIKSNDKINMEVEKRVAKVGQVFYIKEKSLNKLKQRC